MKDAILKMVRENDGVTFEQLSAITGFAGNDNLVFSQPGPGAHPVVWHKMSREACDAIREIESLLDFLPCCSSEYTERPFQDVYEKGFHSPQDGVFFWVPFMVCMADPVH